MAPTSTCAMKLLDAKKKKKSGGTLVCSKNTEICDIVLNSTQVSQVLAVGVSQFDSTHSAKYPAGK